MNSLGEVKVRLAKIGIENISKLQDDPELLHVWREIRTDVAAILKKGDKDIVAIGDFFPTFQLDMWTDSPWLFDTERDSLVVRLWSFLFSSTFQLSAGLVHEANHYRYLKTRTMLGKPESVQEEFAKKHRRRMEILALDEELRFLERTASRFPDQIEIPLTNGHLIYRKNEIIEKCRRNSLAWRQSKDYSEDYKKNGRATSETNYRVIAQALGISLPATKNTQTIRLRFWA